MNEETKTFCQAFSVIFENLLTWSSPDGKSCLGFIADQKMTPNQAKTLLPVITAFAEGKTIQSDLGGWIDVDKTDFTFQFPAERYRIKPEPREFWICCGCGHAWKHDPTCLFLGRTEARCQKIIQTATGGSQCYSTTFIHVKSTE